MDYEARAISFGEANAGDLLAINPNEEQSVTTLHTKRSQARSIAEKTTGQTVYSIATDFKYNTDDDEGSEEEKNSPRGQILFEGLDLLSRNEETRKESNEESLEEQLKKTAKEDLEHKMELAQREDDMIDSDDGDYQDALDSDGDGDDEEEESNSANNQEETRNEAQLLEWDIMQDKTRREKNMRRFRCINANSIQNQVFNKAGPHLKEMAWLSERVMCELQSMAKGNSRDRTKLSDTMLRLLAEEGGDHDDYKTMYKRMDEIRSGYALLFREETLGLHTTSNKMIDGYPTELEEGASEKSNEDKEMTGASKETTVNWSEEGKAQADKRIKCVNEGGNREDDEEEVLADVNKDEEDAKSAASMLNEEIGRKPLPSALRSKKMGSIQSNLDKGNDEVDKQEALTLRGGGGK